MGKVCNPNQPRRTITASSVNGGDSRQRGPRPSTCSNPLLQRTKARYTASKGAKAEKEHHAFEGLSLLRRRCHRRNRRGARRGGPIPEQQAARSSQDTVFVSRDENGRTRTRIIVTPRSYLDGGTEVLPGQRKFSFRDMEPYWSPIDILGPGKTYERQPLQPAWDSGGTRCCL